MATQQKSRSPRTLSSFRLLSFDIYGTLIDWETGIHDALKPLRDRLPEGHILKTDSLALGARFAAHESRIQAAHPDLTYNFVLRDSYIGLAKELDTTPRTALAGSTDANTTRDDNINTAALAAEGETFAASIAHWAAFPDTVEALCKLKKLGYKLAPLSNVDRISFGHTLAGSLAGLRDDLQSGSQQPTGDPGSDPLPTGEPSSFFDAIYTAQDIGSYKPDLRNFEYLIRHAHEDLGVVPDEILHVAQSLFHDHEPAKKVGLESVWISRRSRDAGTAMGGKLEEYLDQGKVAFCWEFKTLREFADAVQKERGQ